MREQNMSSNQDLINVQSDLNVQHFVSRKQFFELNNW